jgi:hypothetical protein
MSFVVSVIATGYEVEQRRDRSQRREKSRRDVESAAEFSAFADFSAKQPERCYRKKLGRSCNQPIIVMDII